MVLPPLYLQNELRWRKSEEAALRAQDGWLSLVGLAWLSEGISTLGSAEGSTIRLRGPQVPAHIGTASLLNGKVFFQADPESGARLNGRPFSSETLRSDADVRQDRVQVGSLTLRVIQRGKRIGFRASDARSTRRTGFRGLRWFPVDPRYRIEAHFVPQPRPLAITNVLGDVRIAQSPGYAEFRIGGRLVRLDAEDAGNGLFFNFRDATSGRETYGAGRFLDAPRPKQGRVILDFNRATNPPCAFTDYATCPLPPRRNVLPVPVRAGALDGHGG